MTYDLRLEPWIPWRRRSGAVEWGPPAMLVDRLTDDPVVALAAPRPDFDGAVQEFLVGLLTVALGARDDRDWLARWEEPPTVAEVLAALDALPPAFDLEGEGARTFQDLSAAHFVESEVAPIEQMLIESPGDQTTRLNKDLFVKRDRVERLGRPAAAMALITLQTYAPAGGRGNRTSLRGGGPLTTLVDPRVDESGDSRAHEQPLWRKLWANVETERQWAARTARRAPPATHEIYPWLAATRVSDSDDGVSTTPEDVHPLQAYFGLPRRIRLEFAEGGRCDLTGTTDARTVVGFRMRPYGAQYVGWRHPLSPHYKAKANAEWLPVHGQPGGVGWRDWLALTLRAPDAGTREPAAAVSAFARRAEDVGAFMVRVHAFGYDMDNMKARGWTESTLPAFAIADPVRQRLLADTADRLTNAAGIAASALLSAVEGALFQRPKDAPGDLSQVKGELWAATEEPFYAIMRQVAAPDANADVADDACQTFVTTLETQAAALFDRWCPAGGAAPEALRRIVTARFDLVMTLRGYSKLGAKLFAALRIPLPGGGRAARATKSRSRKEATT